MMRAEIILETESGRYQESMTGSCSAYKDGIALDVTSLHDGLILSIRTDRDSSLALSLCFPSKNLSAESIFIPSVWYGGNMEGEGCFPSARRASSWTFIETRMPMPGIIGERKEDGWTFFWMDECKAADALASAGWNGDGIIFRLPYHEAPFSYRGKTRLQEAGNPPLLHLDPGTAISRRIHIFESGEEDPYDGYRKLIRERFNYCQTLKGGNWEGYAESKLKRLLGLVIRTSDDNAALIMGEGNGDHQSVYRFTAGSFLVKSLEAASALLRTDSATLSSSSLEAARDRAAGALGISADEWPKEIAARIGRYFLSSETGDGFYQDSISLDTGERGGYLGIGEHPEFRYLMNARCAGEAMASYIDLYERTGYIPFMELPRRVMHFFISHQLSDGSFGRWWDRNGEAVDRNGTNGAYVAVALSRLLPHLSDESERQKAEKSLMKAIGYYSALSLSGSFHGDTLDADSVDKEAGVSLLSLMLESLESGYGSEDTLKAAIKAASFILTWIWEMDSYISPDSPLGRLGFRSQGMTSVSAAHHHLDFYGMLIAHLYLRLWKLTGDDLWKNQAMLMMNACLRLIASNDNGYLGRAPSFDGWQPEQINHTTWDYFSSEDNMNGTYGIDIAWVNVLGYSSYLSIKEDFPGLLNI